MFRVVVRSMVRVKDRVWDKQLGLGLKLGLGHNEH